MNYLKLEKSKGNTQIKEVDTSANGDDTDDDDEDDDEEDSEEDEDLDDTNF